MDDNQMIGPGARETAAESMMGDKNTAGASVQALLAIASAINRLADAVENHSATSA